jgi:hypothetical protein
MTIALFFCCYSVFKVLPGTDTQARLNVFEDSVTDLRINIHDAGPQHLMDNCLDDCPNLFCWSIPSSVGIYISITLHHQSSLYRLLVAPKKIEKVRKA